MPRGVPFILIAAVAAGLWSVLMSRASRDVHPLLGPVVAESTGAILGLILILGTAREAVFQYSTRGLGLLLFAGVCVFSVDYFNLRAYGAELPVTVATPIFLGGALVVATVIGLFLGEGMSTRKLAGIVLVLMGVVLLGGVAE